jgi:hypothetical protein
MAGHNAFGRWCLTVISCTCWRRGYRMSATIRTRINGQQHDELYARDVQRWNGISSAIVNPIVPFSPMARIHCLRLRTRMGLFSKSLRSCHQCE